MRCAVHRVNPSVCGCLHAIRTRYARGMTSMTAKLEASLYIPTKAKVRKGTLFLEYAYILPVVYVFMYIKDIKLHIDLLALYVKQKCEIKLKMRSK